jgi:hypothetical protein
LTVEPVRDSEDGTPADVRSIATGTQPADASTTASFDVAPGVEIVLRLAVIATDGTILDQWDQEVTVPRLDGNELALGTPRFLRARSAFEARALEDGRDPPPTASRRFRQSDRVVVEIECYAPEDQPATVSAQLLNGKGTSLIELGVPPMVAGRTRVVLPLSSLAPSTYVLRIDARAGEHDVQHRAAFQIVP